MDGGPRGPSPTGGHDFDVVVLGAGPAGLAAARQLAPDMRVLVIDAADTLGGAQRSTAIGPYTFDHGSFFFERDHPWFDALPSLRDAFVPAARRQRRIDQHGRLRDYPFEPREVLDWPLGAKLAVLRDLARARILTYRSGGRLSAGDECRRAIGATAFARSGLAAYVERLNRAEPDAVDRSFFFARMSYLTRGAGLGSLARIALRALRRKPLRARPRARLLVRPREGFQAVHGALGDDLAERGVRFRLGETLEQIERLQDGFAIRTDRSTVTAGRVVSAMPLGTVYEALLGKRPGIESLDLLVLFVSGPPEREAEARSRGNVLFNFSTRGLWKRLTVHSEFYELDTERSCLSVEATMRTDEALDPEAVFAEFRDHVLGLGLFGPDLRLEGHATTSGAYPFLPVGGQARVDAALRRLEALGVESVGRQGRFVYFPTSRQIVRDTSERLSTRPAAAAEPTNGLR